MRQTTGLSATRHLDAALGLWLILEELERPGLKLWLARRIQPDPFLAALLELGNIATAVKHFDLAALRGHFGAQQPSISRASRLSEFYREQKLNPRFETFC